MTTFSIPDTFAENWWVLLIRGILAVLFAGMVFTVPDLTLVALVALVLLYGHCSFADGLSAIWVGGQARAWWFVLLGILGVVVGVFAFIYPGILSVLFGVALVAKPAAGALAVVSIIGTYAFIFGLVTIVQAFRLRGSSRRMETFA